MGVVRFRIQTSYRRICNKFLLSTIHLHGSAILVSGLPFGSWPVDGLAIHVRESFAADQLEESHSSVVDHTLDPRERLSDGVMRLVLEPPI